ncbi:hypothetical protein [Maribacter aurantiacus]|uniref:Uncharacterized protein n=1 Tax=Maribacter aurantiacus TaxID=1882343 RepID=A0A5R8M4N6_9FLAO|nr:hypothetical protein [Maribacter aurantiacus]TLF44450.1 hypothetical protein FEK29_11580 [Maribacter aurantiacus]
MSTSSKTNPNIKLLTDNLVLIMFIIVAMLFFQNYHEIENEISSVLLNSLHDINHSIAETRTGK